ncbi:MAG: hypothetical protein ACR2GP_08030 [Burkholderiaceae bacterium]
MFVSVSSIFSGCCAAELQLDDKKKLVWTGDFQQSDFNRFEEILANNGDILALEIRNSRGGDRKVALSMQAYVSSHDVKTSIRGACISACALIFLYSKHREMLRESGRVTYLQIHGSYKADGSFINYFDDSELRVLAERTDGRFPKDLYIKARITAHQQGGLFIFDKPWVLRAGSFFAVICGGLEQRIPADCQGLPGVSAASLGLITVEYHSSEAQPP